jgi:hypothetical protein
MEQSGALWRIYTIDTIRLVIVLSTNRYMCNKTLSYDAP